MLEKLHTMLVNDLKNATEKAMTLLANSVHKLCETTENHSHRITDLDEALSSYNSRIVDLEEMCATLKNSSKRLADTVDDFRKQIKVLQLESD